MLFYFATVSPESILPINHIDSDFYEKHLFFKTGSALKGRLDFYLTNSFTLFSGPKQ